MPDPFTEGRWPGQVRRHADAALGCGQATGGTISRALLDLRIEHFRCIEAAELAFDARLNLFTGPNGSGKTSLLEAVYFLGRGRSFRAPENRLVIRSGEDAAGLFGRIADSLGTTGVGIRLAPGGLDIHVGGKPGGTTADLAGAFPVQAIHAEIGELVHGAPELRRRILDWGVFHVEHGYLVQWRRFRRALLQRNAILREAGADSLIDAWDLELAGAGERVDEFRSNFLTRLTPLFKEVGAELLGESVGLTYQRGWAADYALGDVLRSGRETDRQLGYTRSGPQRADLLFEIDDARSRWRASKGQQKLLAAALVIAQSRLVADLTGNTVGLILDEPAADLDPARLGALMREVLACPAQVFVASITAESLLLDHCPRTFHVEHGKPKALL